MSAAILAWTLPWFFALAIGLGLLAAYELGRRAQVAEQRRARQRREGFRRAQRFDR